MSFASPRSGALLALAVALLWPALAAAEVRIDVQTNTKKLTIDQQLTVRITVQSEGEGSPDVEIPDFAGFEVLSQQVQRPMQFSFNFGQKAVFRSSSIHTFVLAPRQLGKLRIGPVRVRMGGETYTTQPVDILVQQGAGSAPPTAAPGVTPGAPAPDPNADPNAPPQGQARVNPDGTIEGATFDQVAFLRTVVDKAAPYVGQQVRATIYLYLRERLQSAPSIDQEPSTDGFWIRDLLPTGHKLQARRQMVRGVAYFVYTLRRFAAFPLREGELTIGPMSLTIDTSSVFDIFGGGRRRPNIQRTGVPVTLQVKPLPEQGRLTGPVAVGRYAVEAKLDRSQTATGDAVTLTAVVRGAGNIRNVELPTPSVPGLDILDPQVKDLIETPKDRVSGTREYRWLIVPREPGQYQLPPFTLNTFDPARDRYVPVRSRALQLQAVGSALAAQPTPTQPENAPPSEAVVDEALEQVDWAPVRTRSGLSRSASLLVEQPWFGPALALPPILWMLLAGSSLLRRRMAARVLSDSERAQRDADTQLGQAEQAAKTGDSGAFHAAAARAINARLEARVGESVASLTHAQLEHYLGERGMEAALIAGIKERLQGADFARFAPGDASAALPIGELRELLDQLGAFEPGEVA